MSTVQEALNRYWTERSGPYDDHQQQSARSAADRDAWAHVWSAVFPAAPQQVLDVGTGSGYLARLLADLGHEVTGTDLAEGMLVRAREHAARMSAPPTFLRGDAVHPAFPGGTFDAVVNRYVMWTLREPTVALRNWHRLIRPGGTLAVVDSTWFPAGLHTQTTEEFRRAYDSRAREALPLAEATDIEQTAAVVGEAGFRDVTVIPLTRLHELDQQYGVAPHHEARLQHLIRAVRR